MELPNIFYYLLLPLLVLVAFWKILFSKNHRRSNLPPNPPSFPILGHLHLLKSPGPVHRTLEKLAQKYGPIMYLKFGSHPVVVVSKASIAEECFTKNNDIIFANRLKTISGKHISYDNSTMVKASYGDHWRNLRRIGNIEIFSTQRINELQSIRKNEVKHLLVKLSRNSREDFSKVELKSMFHELAFNIMMRMVAGKRYYGDDVSDKEEAKHFRQLMEEQSKYGGVSNAVDFFPILKLIDGGDYEKRVIKLAKKLDSFFQGLVNEIRRERKELDSLNDTIIAHLLRLQDSQPEYYTDEIIKGLILVLLLAGTDTNAVTLEWAMTNLVNNPSMLDKAREELNSEVRESRLIDESDLPKLQYLHSVIFETLRLFPALPLLLPHKSSEKCSVGGYTIPSGTILLINAWVIHRDPELWADAMNFKPERFGSDDGGSGDKSHKLTLPFGMGRRSCPGAGLAQRTLGLTLGLLIQCFEWQRVTKEEEEMTEGRGLTMHKVKPLEVMVKAKPILDKVLSSD